MEDETRTDKAEVEAHKLAQRRLNEGADESEAEKDEPDVEGHKLANKLSQKFDV